MELERAPPVGAPVRWRAVVEEGREEERAAEQGTPYAQFNLGMMYRNGEGVEQNDAEAVRWLLCAACQRLAFAQNHLGSMYYLGRGVDQSDLLAVYWFRLAAEQGDPSAQQNLGDSASSVKRRCRN